jgi:hypothetical protein
MIGQSSKVDIFPAGGCQLESPKQASNGQNQHQDSSSCMILQLFCTWPFLRVIVSVCPQTHGPKSLQFGGSHLFEKDLLVRLLLSILRKINSQATFQICTVQALIAWRARSTFLCTAVVIYVAGHLDIYTWRPSFPASCTTCIAFFPSRFPCRRLEEANCKNCAED